MLIAEHGGEAGILDEGRLEAALTSPRNHWSHGERDLFTLAAAYGFALAKNHPFVDGNKRTSLTISGVFLEINGWKLDADERDAVGAALALAAGRSSLKEFSQWLKASSSKKH
ncbi:MAG: type II toxin-antitoxin system death-on-curing family toxin [Candidatus Eisenbacteria bacterium]|uniref:Type II toxin-antitoxin system death-on-curing family toxin n=1 Tax=Eiseniibacteriota bacterium TaxID=2212470 RepID=A0A7Y2E9I5_UNCEI|nr:type II toxin-antitoxin system death-on-curing family toxin [Candidatus Eisenbacteria bacterium]